MFRPNRWQLCITTRPGLGVVGVADPHAPSFHFGDHFVVDVFINFAPAPHDTTFLANTVFYGIEYLEAPADQRKFDASQKPIDTKILIEHLEFEIAELERDIASGDDMGFVGDPVNHLRSMNDAIHFVRAQEQTPLFMVAHYDG